MNKWVIVAAVVGVLGVIGAATGGNGNGAQSMFCSDFKSAAAGWVPETLGGDAPVNDLPSDADLEHEAYQLSQEAPADLASQMSMLVSAAGAHDAATFYTTTDSIVTSCRTE